MPRTTGISRGLLATGSRTQESRASHVYTPSDSKRAGSTSKLRGCSLSVVMLRRLPYVADVCPEDKDEAGDAMYWPRRTSSEKRRPNMDRRRETATQLNDRVPCGPWSERSYSALSEACVSSNVSSWNSFHDRCISRRNCEMRPGETRNRSATSPVLCPTASA